MFRPFAAYRAGLRRRRFVDLNTGSKLIIEQGDAFAITCRGNRLRLRSPQGLRRIVVLNG
jgi:hypothetical protein